MTDAEALRESLGQAVDRFGGIDGVVSNAESLARGTMQEVSDDDLRSSFEVNFFAHQTLAAAASRILRGQGTGGFMLFNASHGPANAEAELGAYAVPKAGLIALMQQYAREEGAGGIRVAAVNAERVRVGGWAADAGDASGEYYRANLLGRPVTCEDVADAFLFLALAQSTTGCVLSVDGGLAIRKAL